MTSIEDVSYFGSFSQYNILAFVIENLPADEAKWVADNITFVCVVGISALACMNWRAFPPADSLNLVVIGDQGDKTEEEIAFTIAHGIAHVRCATEITCGRKSTMRMRMRQMLLQILGAFRGGALG